MKRAVTFKPCSLISSPKTSLWLIRLGKSGKSARFSWWQCKLILPSSAPLPIVGFHSKTTSKRRSIPFLPVCTAFTSTIQPGACLRSWASPCQGINLILGMKTHITREPTRCFALSLGYRQIRTGGRSWTTGVKALGLGVH